MNVNEGIFYKCNKNTEYFCNTCGQLRLAVYNENPTYCKNCGGNSIIVGKPGTLDKDVLKANWKKKINYE